MTHLARILESTRVEAEKIQIVYHNQRTGPELNQTKKSLKSDFFSTFLLVFRLPINFFFPGIDIEGRSEKSNELGGSGPMAPGRGNPGTSRLRDFDLSSPVVSECWFNCRRHRDSIRLKTVDRMNTFCRLAQATVTDQKIYLSTYGSFFAKKYS